MSNSCVVSFGNTGEQRCTENVGVFSKLILVPKNDKIALADVPLFATWSAKLNDNKAARAYPLPRIFNLTDETEDVQTVEGIDGQIELIREGKYRFSGEFASISAYLAKQIRKVNTGLFDAYILTSLGYIGGYESGTDLAAYTLSQMRIDTPKLPGEDKIRTRFYCEMEVPEQFADARIWVKPDFSTSLIRGVLDAKINVIGTPTSTTLVLDVTEYSNDAKITGLVDANFLIVDLSNVEQTPTSVLENTNGTYTLTFAALISGVAALNGQPVAGGTAFVELSPETGASTTFTVV